MRPLQLFSLVTLVAATSVLVGLNAAQEPDLKPTGKGVGTLDHPPMPEQAQSQGPNGQATRAAKPTSNGISYHGGPVMTNGVKMYYIWYGSQWDTASKNVLTNLGQHIGGSPYFNINTTYYDRVGARVSNGVTYAGATSDAYSQGKSLSDAAIFTVVSSAINSGRLPKDSHGVYFVLTSADITASK